MPILENRPTAGQPQVLASRFIGGLPLHLLAGMECVESKFSIILMPDDILRFRGLAPMPVG